MATEQVTENALLPGERRRTPSVTATVLISGNVVLLAIVVWGSVNFGSIRAATGYYLRGETLFVDSSQKSFGIAGFDERVSVTFALRNRGRRPIRVLGCQVSCSCTVPPDLPFAIQPNESREFTLRIRAPGRRESQSDQAHDLTLHIILFTSNPLQARIPLVVKGRIQGRPDR